MTLMGGVFDVIDSTLSQHTVEKVTQVKLKIGRLTNAEPDALNFAFEAYSKGTLCEGAELLVEIIPVRGQCQDCGEEFSLEELLFRCPKCKKQEIKVIQGDEMLLESLEVE
jgi:hydrogenase nickel incorporation protein HypA/HybF